MIGIILQQKEWYDNKAITIHNRMKQINILKPKPKTETNKEFFDRMRVLITEYKNSKK